MLDRAASVAPLRDLDVVRSPITLSTLNRLSTHRSGYWRGARSRNRSADQRRGAREPDRDAVTVMRNPSRRTIAHHSRSR
jgi:hypothetical protein